MTQPTADPARSRTVSWSDPAELAAAGRGMTGLAFLEAIVAGELPPPPLASVLGFGLSRVAEGEAWFAGTPDESLYNPIGAVHGGVICTLLDSVLGCALHATLPAGTGYTSIEIKVNYMRGVRADSGELTAHGWVAKPGRRVAFAEGDVRDAADRLVATASGSLLVFPLP